MANDGYDSHLVPVGNKEEKKVINTSLDFKETKKKVGYFVFVVTNRMITSTQHSETLRVKMVTMDMKVMHH